MITRSEPRGWRGVARINAVAIYLLLALAASASYAEGITEPDLPESPGLVPEIAPSLEEPGSIESGDLPKAMSAAESVGIEGAQPATKAEPSEEAALSADASAGTPIVADESEKLPLFADEEVGATEDKVRPKELSIGWMVASAGFWLGVVLLFICGVLWAVKRFFPGATSSFKSPAAEVLGRTFLDARKCLFVVKVGRRVVVVGSTPERLATLCEVSEPGEVDALVALALGESTPASASTGFRKAMVVERSRYDGPHLADSADSADEFVAGEAGLDANASAEAPEGILAMSRIRGEVLRIKQKLQDLRDAS